MTVAELLAEARQRLKPRKGMLFPEREARALLAHLLGKEEVFLLAHPEGDVSEGAAALFRDWLARREQGEPFHLILGSCPFFGRRFRVAPGVLIPRPETELLVATAVQLPLPPEPRVLDVGTGSGALAISFKAEVPHAHVFASDIAWPAVLLARFNATQERAAVPLALGHLATLWRGPFDLVLANLPYLPDAARADVPVELSFEDPQALFGGEDGLSLIRPLIRDLPRILAPGAFAVLEMGEGQAGQVVAELPWPLVPHDVVYDVRGVERVLVLTNSPNP